MLSIPRLAHELIGIEASDAVAVCDGCKIDEVDEGVDLIEFLALQHAADELLAGWTIARGILAAGFVYTAGGSYARELFEAVGGQFLTKAVFECVNLIPEFFAVL